MSIYLSIYLFTYLSFLQSVYFYLLIYLSLHISSYPCISLPLMFCFRAWNWWASWWRSAGSRTRVHGLQHSGMVSESSIMKLVMKEFENSSARFTSLRYGIIAQHNEASWCRSAGLRTHVYCSQHSGTVLKVLFYEGTWFTKCELRVVGSRIRVHISQHSGYGIIR